MPTTWLTKPKLAAIGICNPHLLFFQTSAKVFIYYSPQQTGRAYRSAGWKVVGKGFKTDPNGHWMDDGDKSFMVGRKGDKESVLAEAKVWAAKYGITEWARDPFGCWHDAALLAETMRRLQGREGTA